MKETKIKQIVEILEEKISCHDCIRCFNKLLNKRREVMEDVFVVNNAEGARFAGGERVPNCVIEQYYDCLDGKELDEAGERFWIFPLYTYCGRRIELGISFPLSKLKNCVCCGLAFADRGKYKNISSAKAAVREYLKTINKRRMS